MKVFLIISIVTIFIISCDKNLVNTQKLDEEERILFLRGGKDISEICTMKPDGSDVKVISRHNFSDDEYYPGGYMFARWSPDKSRIVVSGGPGSTLEYWPLWLMDMDGNLLYKITWNGYMPLWTSDGENVIFARRRDYSSVIYDIYKININSLQKDTIIVAEVGELGSSSGYIYQLLDIFSQNNSKLLLNEMHTYRDASGTQITDDAEIIIYDYLNNKKTYLTNNNLEEGWGRESPDGNTIVYSIKNIGSIRYSNNLYLMTQSWDSIRQLTFGSTDVYSYLAWSPDGKRLAYTKSDQSNGYNPYEDIFIINIQSGSIDRLTNTTNDSIYYAIMDWK